MTKQRTVTVGDRTLTVTSVFDAKMREVFNHVTGGALDVIESNLEENAKYVASIWPVDTGRSSRAFRVHTRLEGRRIVGSVYNDATDAVGNRYAWFIKNVYNFRAPGQFGKAAKPWHWFRRHMGVRVSKKVTSEIIEIIRRME